MKKVFEKLLIDPEAGVILRKKTRKDAITVCYNDGKSLYRVSVDGKLYTPGRLIWEYAKGKIPSGSRVYKLNKEVKDDFSIGNLYIA